MGHELYSAKGYFQIGFDVKDVRDPYHIAEKLHEICQNKAAKLQVSNFPVPDYLTVQMLLQHGIDISTQQASVVKLPSLHSWGLGVNFGYNAMPDDMLAGRCISGDFYPHASYRVMGNMAATGEAGGYAAAMWVKEHILPREFDGKRASVFMKEAGYEI